jgi:hypothetical protein
MAERHIRSAYPGTPRALVAVGFSLALVVAVVWPALAQAESAPSKKPTTTKKTPVKPAPVKRVAPVAAAAPVLVEAPLNEAELAVAAQVHVGALPCELGKVVRMELDVTTPGFFRLHIDQQRYRLRPVESRTGAVRLEDPHQGVVWIQLANKSMLMSQKLGRRLADECAGDAQQQVAAALKLNPAPSLLDPLPPETPPVVVVSTPVPPLNLDQPVPVPALVANDCRRPVNTSSLPSGAEPC